MLLTVFLDYPSNLACFTKPSLKDLIEEMKATTPLTEEMILEQFTDSLGTILVFGQEEGAWEELFELMEPKKFTEDGGIESTGVTTLSEEEKTNLKIGANNFAVEMKILYPEIFAETMRVVDEAQKLNAFLVAVNDAQDDPEITELLNSTPDEEPA